MKIEIKGGDKLQKILEEIAKNVDRSARLNVGFLEGTTERKNNLPTALIAVWNEFGTNTEVPAHDVTVYRKVDQNGDFLRDGRFVKRKEANFSTTHHVEAYTISTPPRPFFRRMIAMGKDGWGGTLAEQLKENKYDAERSLHQLGGTMETELTNSITANVYAPLAASTKRKKGHENQLVDSHDMLNSVNHEVI